MAKYRVRFTADGQAQERTVTASSRDEAVRQVQADGGLYFSDIVITDVTKIAGLVKDAGPAKPDAAPQPSATGRERVAGVVKSATARLELATRSGRPGTRRASQAASKATSSAALWP